MIFGIVLSSQGSLDVSVLIVVIILILVVVCVVFYVRSKDNKRREIRGDNRPEVLGVAINSYADVIAAGITLTFTVHANAKEPNTISKYEIDFDGIVNFIEHQYNTTDSSSIKRWAKAYMDKIECPSCGGSRLKKEVLYFKLNNKNIAELKELREKIITKNKLSVEDEFNKPLEKSAWTLGTSPVLGLDNDGTRKDKLGYEDIIDDECEIGYH